MNNAWLDSRKDKKPIFTPLPAPSPTTISKQVPVLPPPPKQPLLAAMMHDDQQVAGCADPFMALTQLFSRAAAGAHSIDLHHMTLESREPKSYYLIDFT